MPPLQGVDYPWMLVVSFKQVHDIVKKVLVIKIAILGRPGLYTAEGKVCL
jgi:hypothetical protein